MKCFKAEFDAFKRKIKLRANDLASELVNEYLREERDQSEWQFFPVEIDKLKF